MEDIETININIPTHSDKNKLKQLVKEFLKKFGLPEMEPNEKEMERFLSKMRNKYKINTSKSQMRFIYENDLMEEFPQLNHIMGIYLIKKSKN